jgi:hypothetical protein
MSESNFDYWREIIETLDKGGMTRNPYLLKVCRQCWEGNYRPLQKLLVKRPSLLRRAKRNMAEIEEAQEKNPYRIEHKNGDLNGLGGDIRIGKIIPYGQDVGIFIITMTGHMGVYARTGAGKTLLLRRLAWGLHRAGLSLMIFDVKGDYLDMFRDDPDILVFRKKHLLYSHFEVHDPRSREDIQESMRSDVKVLADALYLGATGVPTIEDALEELFEEKGVYEGSGRWPTFQDVLLKVKSRSLKGGSKTSDVLATIETRFRPFIRSQVFNQERGIPLSVFKNKTVIIDMSGMDEAERPLIGNGVVMKIFRHHFLNNLRGNEPRHVFFYEEGYHYHDAELTDNYSSFFLGTSSGKQLFRMGREFGLCFVVSGPQVSSISRYVRENSSTVIAFRTQDQSLKLLQENMGLTDEQTQYFYKLQKFEGVIRLPDFEYPLLFKLDVESFPQKDVTADEIDRHMKPVIEKIHKEISRPTTERERPVDLEQIEQDANNKKIGVIILRTLKQDAFLHRSAILEQLHGQYGIPKKSLGHALDWLVDQGLVAPTKARSKTRDAEYYPLTKSAQDALRIPEAQRTAPSHFKHTLYMKVVSAWLESQGYDEVYQEYACNSESVGQEGRIDILAVKDGRRTAYEITLSLSNLMKNIFKGLEGFGVDELHVVCETQQDLEKAMESVSEKISAQLLERITWDTLTDFF